MAEGSVLDYAFTSHALCNEMKSLAGIWEGECVIGPAAGNIVHQWEHAMVAVPEKWFSTAMAEFYYPEDFD